MNISLLLSLRSDSLPSPRSAPPSATLTSPTILLFAATLRASLTIRLLIPCSLCSCLNGFCSAGLYRRTIIATCPQLRIPFFSIVSRFSFTSSSASVQFLSPPPRCL